MNIIFNKDFSFVFKCYTLILENVPRVLFLSGGYVLKSMLFLPLPSAALEAVHANVCMLDAAHTASNTDFLFPAVHTRH